MRKFLLLCAVSSIEIIISPIVFSFISKTKKKIAEKNSNSERAIRERNRLLHVYSQFTMYVIVFMCNSSKQTVHTIKSKTKRHKKHKKHIVVDDSGSNNVHFYMVWFKIFALHIRKKKALLSQYFNMSVNSNVAAYWLDFYVCLIVYWLAGWLAGCSAWFDLLAVVHSTLKYARIELKFLTLGFVSSIEFFCSSFCWKLLHYYNTHIIWGWHLVTIEIY